MTTKVRRFRLLREAALGLVACAAFTALPIQPASAAANCIKGDRKPPYTIGWANIYSVPTWMKQTEGTISKEVEELKGKGLVDKLVITDAQGNANNQIQQIQSMIDADVDAIVLIAGSATALDRVVADACDKGIAVINFDSLVTTDKVTAKVNTDSAAWGSQAAEWLIGQMGGKGKIIVLNGPAGISVSDDRRKGADPVLAANPNVQILAETNTDYNVAPAQEAVTNLLFNHPEIDGVLSLGGALTAGAILSMDRQGRKLVPMTGENYRQFLELWKEKGLKGWATMQPNWLGALAVYTAVQALEGKNVPAFVKVPLPIINDENLEKDYLSRAGEFPADGYIYSDYDDAMFEQLLTQK
jgi:ribose transport system substrate-binding protein